MTDIVGKTMREIFPLEPEIWFETYDAVLKTGIGARFAQRSDTLQRDFELFAFRLEGQDRQIGIIFADVSIRRRAELILQASEQQLQEVADSIPQLAWIADAQGATYWYNKRWFDYTGATLEDMKGWGWCSLQHPDEVDRVRPSLERAIHSGQGWEDTFALRGKDGGYRWFLSRARPIKDARGKIFRWFGSNTDVTDQRHAEEQRALLLNEMNHRIKNLFAIAGGVVALSARSTNTPKEMAKAIQGRLGALAQAHQLIAPIASDGSGRPQQSSVDALVKTILLPYSGAVTSGGDARATIEGPDVIIAGEAVTSFALILHELATNAAKYGAYSTLEGRVHVSWTFENEKLEMAWEESGGPIVSSRPEREGFGSRLARTSVNNLAGELNFDWRSEGLAVRFTAAAERLAL